MLLELWIYTLLLSAKLQREVTYRLKFLTMPIINAPSQFSIDLNLYAQKDENHLDKLLDEIRVTRVESFIKCSYKGETFKFSWRLL